MRIPSNKISSVIRFFHSELKDIYPEGEITAFIKLSFSKVLNINSAQLLLKKEETLTESELLKFNFIIKDLKNEVPIQYVLGETEFYGRTFKTDKRALIPRPETEELVHWIIDEFKGAKDLNVLDIGTGSGCIAITLASELNHSKVHALDISDKALELTSENAVKLGAEIVIINGDAGNPGTLPDSQFDIIVSNPPYILPEEKDSMSRNVLDYEPENALFTPPGDALFFYRNIMNYASGHLKEGGKLFFEIHESQSEALKELAKKWFKNVNLRQDLYAKPRMLCVY